MNESSSSPNACPKCGTALPSAATAGLCPRCLMAEAMQATQTEAAPATPQKALSPAELAPHFPQLEVLECLGRGGMGVVYKVRQKSLNRFAALKLLAPERVADAKFAQRFTHEAQALAALNHPSIVTIYDFGQAGGFYFLLMEFVDGVNLRQAMKAGRFTPEQALAVVPPVCEALQYAHEHGIVHRDIKPENLLLDKDGRVKIADFGIAKMLHADSSDVGLAESQPVGTPRYMAPEQKEHRRTDHRADIYSLGVVLYELLTGEMPADKLQPPSRKVQIDVRLDEIVLRALETKPELRFQTAGEFRTQVETFDREGREEKRVDRSEKMENSQAPAPLSSSRSSLSSSPPPLLKTANSYVSTPEWLASARGKFWVYSGKGTLVLTRDQLVFTNEKTGAPVTIPLAAIRDVSLGTYPWLAKPAPLHYLSVTWEEGGLTRCRYFTPNCGWACPVWETNPLVIEWHQAVRTAVTAASGKAPAETPAPPHRPCVADFAWMGLMFGLPMLLIGAVLLHFHRMMGESNPLWKSGWFLFAAVFAVIGLVRLMRRLTRKDDSSTTSSENSDAPGSPDVGQAHTSAINPTAKSVALFCSSALLGALIWLLSPLFTGHREPWDADSPYYWLGLALAGFVPACFDAKRPWLYALGVWIGQVVAFLSLVLASAPSGGLWGIGLVMLSFYSLLGLLGALLGAGAHRLFCGHSSHADGAIGKRQPRWQGWGVGVIGICVAVFVIPPVVMMLVALLSYRQVEAPSGVTHLDLAPVGVSNNVVIVAVTIEGGRGHSELRAGLDGPPLPAATEAALAGTFSPPFAGTFIKPTPYPGNHPFRILSPGRMTWLLGFVLPDAALAKSALENLRPIGPLPSVAGRTFAGTLFEVRQTNGQVFHASLQVRPPVTAADPNWVSVSSAPSTPSASALSSYDESGRVILKWEVQASQPGIVLLHREDGQSTASLRRDPKTKLYQAGISVELTKVGTDRVLLVTSSGGILREELTGNFRDLAAELWSYKNLSAKTVRGAEIELCKFQGKPITVQVPVLTVTTASPTAPATNPGIQRVEISTDKAVVHQAHYDGSGLLITFGTGTNRWTPSGRNLDGLFNVTLEWPAFGRGSLHVIKPRHGIHMNYRLDGPPGPMVGKLVFDPGTALPDAEGFCVIGKFQPDSGEPLPLAVQLGTDQPTQPGGASIRPSAAGTSATTTAPITFRRDGVSWSFLTVGVGVIGLCVIGVVVLLVVLVRKGGTAGKVVAVLVTVPLLLLMLGVAAFVGYRWMATSSVQDAAQVASKKLGQMVLETNFPNSLVPQPRGRVLQTQNGFRVHLPAMQLASFEFLIRDADDTWRAVPALTAYVATGTNGGYHDTLTWTLRRDDKPHTENSTSQLWFWSVSATVNGGQQLPHLADHGTNFTHTLARGDQLDWSQLGIPPQTTLKPGEELLLPLFRTSGSATARGNMPKEAFVRVRCEPLPAALNLSDRDQFTELGLAAHAALAKVLPAKPLPATTPRKNAHGVSPIKSSIADGDNSPAAIAAAQKQGIASATEDIQAGVFRILAYGDLIPTSPADKDEETGFRIQWVAGSILGNAFRAEADAYNFAMREWFWKNRPGPAATVPAKNIPAVAPLIRREERGKTRDGRDFVMTFEELRRDEKTSTVTVKTVNGGSVGSAMFEVRGNWEIAKARGAAYFINLKSWQGENGQWMSLTGFAADKNVDPKTYFALKEPLPADKRLVFLSVAAYERIFKDQP